MTENKKSITSATQIAQEIKKKIYEITGLTASAEVSFNKFLAKIASDFNKPDGLTVVTPEKADEFINRLPIRKFFGIGKATEKRMHDIGIKTGADLKEMSRDELTQVRQTFKHNLFDIIDLSYLEQLISALHYLLASIFLFTGMIVFIRFNGFCFIFKQL